MALASLKVSAAASVQGQTQPGTVQLRSVKVTQQKTTGLVLISGGGFVGPSAAFTALGNVGATATLDAQDSRLIAITMVLTSAVCVISVINAVAGSQIDVIPFQDGTPPRLVTHPAAVAWTSTGPPTLSSNANAPDRFQYTVLAVDGSGNPTQIVGSLGFTSGSAPQPINPPVIT